MILGVFVYTSPTEVNNIIIQTLSLHNDQVISSYDIKHIRMAVIERPVMTKHSYPVKEKFICNFF